MDTRTTTIIGSLGVIAFTAVSAGMWHYAVQLDTQARIAAIAAREATSTAVAVATSTPQTQPQAPAGQTIPKYVPPPRTSSASSSGQTSSSTATVSEAVQVAGVGTLNHLRTLASSLTCAVATIGTTPKRTGTVYVDGSQLRADLQTAVSGHTFDSAMIMNNDSLYVWMAAGSYGVQLPTTSLVSGSVAASRGGIDPIAPISYSCNLWKPDLSQFTLPTNITFSTPTS